MIAWKPRTRLEDVIGGLEDAWEFFGGVAKRVVLDNLKAAVLRCFFGFEEKPELHRSYRELARHYLDRIAAQLDLDEAVRERVRGLQRQWAGESGFGGYLVGHEDYRREYYPALRRTVEALRGAGASVAPMSLPASK